MSEAKNASSEPHHDPNALIHALIEDILDKEKGFVDHPADKGGPTCWGIAKRFHPEAWVDGPPTRDAARAIYRRQYIERPGFLQIQDPALRAQLVDYGVNSGPILAIQRLQTVLGCEPDGKLGPQTLAAANAADPIALGNRVMAERLKMFGRIVAKDKKQAAFISGWIIRALSFLR